MNTVKPLVLAALVALFSIAARSAQADTIRVDNDGARKFLEFSVKAGASTCAAIHAGLVKAGLPVTDAMDGAKVVTGNDIDASLGGDGACKATFRYDPATGAVGIVITNLQIGDDPTTGKKVGSFALATVNLTGRTAEIFNGYLVGVKYPVTENGMKKTVTGEGALYSCTYDADPKSKEVYVCAFPFKGI